MLHETSEVVHIDSTYSLNHVGMSLYGLVMEDSFERGQLARLALPCGETSLCIETMLSHAKAHNPRLDHTHIQSG